MLKRNVVLLSSVVLILASASSCNQPIEFPDGVQVLINGESIEGSKVVLVNPGEEIRLQVTGLQASSAINFKVTKLGIKVHEQEISVNGEGSVDEMIPLPDIQVQVTAVINFSDWAGVEQEMSFVIKLKE